MEIKLTEEQIEDAFYEWFENRRFYPEPNEVQLLDAWFGACYRLMGYKDK